jgi:hypothetical protein
MGFGSAFVVVRGHLRFLMRFPLWFAAKVERLLSGRRGFMTVFAVIFGFNSVAMFLYMLSGVVDLLPGVIDFLTGMNIGIVFLAKHPLAEGEAGSESGDSGTGEAEKPGTGPSLARQALILIGFVVVTGLELPALWISIAMGIGLCHFARPDGVICMTAQEICVRTQAYLLVILPVLAVSAFAETVSVRLMQADMREMGA